MPQTHLILQQFGDLDISGELEIGKRGISLLKIKGLRRRWLINTVSIVCALGLVCVCAVTIVFAAYYYSSMESDMSYRARTTTDFFADYLNQSYNQYYQSCITYAQTFEGKDNLELQFINKQGELVASSYGDWAGKSPRTPEIQKAVASRYPEQYLGKDPVTGERIMAVSSPMIYSNGEVIGVLRYVTSTSQMDRQIVSIAVVSFGALIVVVLLVLFSSNYYIRSILVPLTIWSWWNFTDLTGREFRISHASSII